MREIQGEFQDLPSRSADLHAAENDAPPGVFAHAVPSDRLQSRRISVISAISQDASVGG